MVSAEASITAQKIDTRNRSSAVQVGGSCMAHPSNPSAGNSSTATMNMGTHLKVVVAVRNAMVLQNQKLYRSSGLASS